MKKLLVMTKTNKHFPISSSVVFGQCFHDNKYLPTSSSKVFL